MTKPGHIKIKNNEIIFVYHELEKPQLTKEDYFEPDKNYQISKEYNKKLKEYEASKREAKVSNVILKNINMGFWIENSLKVMVGIEIELKHNQPCEAEIENGIATITKIL